MHDNKVISHIRQNLTGPNRSHIIENNPCEQLNLPFKNNIAVIIILPYNCSKSLSLTFLQRSYLHSIW